ncbi:hypothetical protein GYMLUDRAFT_85865 [Collybiopsis luxurians FD-317 M1]|uniref:Uncharacterized protein n=1 Tax=Collybiopsis luxurians FD-317 M1 TaxID=944289 RepID=A0A0D0CUP3_9AGAR|nr:hypothetical protein GYMLUDRAFT_85865 [Collybiopsis luxurians FD-317 M1]
MSFHFGCRQPFLTSEINSTENESFDLSVMTLAHVDEYHSEVPHRLDISSTCIHIQKSLTSEADSLICKPLGFLAEDENGIAPKAEKLAILLPRPNLHDEPCFVLQFTSSEDAKKFCTAVARKAAAIPRQLATKIYISQTPDSANLLDVTQYSHRYLLATVSECLTAVAYGDAASILAPINGWTLEGPPSAASVQMVQNTFRERPPPVVIIGDYPKGLSCSQVKFNKEHEAIINSGFHSLRSSSQMISPTSSTPINLPPLCELAVPHFGYHICNGSHQYLKCIYVSPTLAGLFIDTVNWGQDHGDLPEVQKSIHVVRAALKIAIMHELVHFLNKECPLRNIPPGAADKKFDDCVDLENRLEAGLVLEKFWLGKIYRVGYENNSSTSLILLCSIPLPPLAPDSSSDDSLSLIPQGSLFESERPASTSSKGDSMKSECDTRGLDTAWVEDPAVAKRFHVELLPIGFVHSDSSELPPLSQRRTVDRKDFAPNGGHSSLSDSDKQSAFCHSPAIPAKSHWPVPHREAVASTVVPLAPLPRAPPCDKSRMRLVASSSLVQKSCVIRK